VEGYLEEMLVLCQRSEEYNGFMLAKMAEACAPALLGAARENAFRSGQFNVVVRELIAYYINMVTLAGNMPFLRVPAILSFAPLSQCPRCLLLCPAISMSPLSSPWVGGPSTYENRLKTVTLKLSYICERRDPGMQAEARLESPTPPVPARLESPTLPVPARLESGFCLCESPLLQMARKGRGFRMGR
jgi:hypothetical protein